jgi:hypothetical protein
MASLLAVGGWLQQLTPAGITENDEPVAVPDGAGDELADRRVLAFTSDEHRTSSIRAGRGGGVSAP